MLTIKEIYLSLAVTVGNDIFFSFTFGGGVGLVEVIGWIETGWDLETNTAPPFISCEFEANDSTSLKLAFLIWTVGRVTEKNDFVRLLRVRKIWRKCPAHSRCW